MTDLVLGILRQSWSVLAEAAPWVLLGFLAAGFVRAFVSDETVGRHLGGNNARSVLKASLIGIPLPLCSCGVLPAAVGLRHQGAGRGPAAAFMVSTPESGIDSIAITWALLDPIMTVFRPVAAFLTATVTGLAINALPEEGPTEVTIQADASSPVDPTSPAGSAEPADGTVAAGASCHCGCAIEAGSPASQTVGERLRAGLTYAFGELLGDIGWLLLLGVLIAGIIAWLVPAESLAALPGGEPGEMLILLVAGIPLYICATASTPIAAALVLKGISPGAALVFLLAGPATNAATVTVFARHWGRRATVVYLLAIATCAVVLGYGLNRIYAWSGIDITRWVAGGVETGPGVLGTVPAVILILLILREKLGKRANA